MPHGVRERSRPLGWRERVDTVPGGLSVCFPSPGRYKSLCPDTWPHWRGPPGEGVERLIKYIGYTPEEYKLGKYVVSRLPTDLSPAVQTPPTLTRIHLQPHFEASCRFISPIETWRPVARRGDGVLKGPQCSEPASVAGMNLCLQNEEGAMGGPPTPEPRFFHH